MPLLAVFILIVDFMEKMDFVLNHYHSKCSKVIWKFQCFLHLKMSVKWKEIPFHKSFILCLYNSSTPIQPPIQKPQRLTFLDKKRYFFLQKFVIFYPKTQGLLLNPLYLALCYRTCPTSFGKSSVFCYKK